MPFGKIMRVCLPTPDPENIAAVALPLSSQAKDIPFTFYAFAFHRTFES